MPGLQPWMNKVSECATRLPGIAFFPIEIAEDGADELEIRIAYATGIESKSYNFSYTIGQETIELIVHPTNPVRSLGDGILEEVMSGRLIDWSQVPGTQPGIPSPYTQTITLFTYPDGDPVQQVLVHTTGAQISPAANLVPDPAAMIAAVQMEPGALGYVPRGWLEGTDVATLENRQSGQITVSVVAYTQDQPGGALKALLLCLQRP
jgi:ABC-type phosphate transport system substrate-binding protein